MQMGLNGSLLRLLGENEFEGRLCPDELGCWLKQAETFRGQEVICYHKNWAYFEERFGLVCAEYVETKPGIPPTPRHVARLIDLMQNEGIGVVFASSYFDGNKVETVARRGDAQAVIVPMYNGARPGLDDYFDVVDLWVGSLAAALGASGHP